MTKCKVNCRLYFLPVILDASWFSVVMVRVFMLMILAVAWQQSYVTGLVNVQEVRVAAEVESAMVTLVVDLCDWESS